MLAHAPTPLPSCIGTGSRAQLCELWHALPPHRLLRATLLPTWRRWPTPRCATPSGALEWDICASLCLSCAACWNLCCKHDYLMPPPPTPTPAPSRSYGVAFLHETQSEAEQAVARLLFESGAVQVLVATAPMCWGLTAAAHLTVIMGTQVGGCCRGADGSVAKGMGLRAAATGAWTGGCAAVLLANQSVSIATSLTVRRCATHAAAPPPAHSSAQYYDVTGQGTNDYPVTDLLQMMGRASRPLHDEQGM